MNRLGWFLICAILGLGLLLEGLSVPAHLRAVDASVLALAGHRTPGVVSSGLALAGEQKLGAAQIMAQAAQQQSLPERDKLDAVVKSLSQQHPDWQIWGGPEPRLEELLGAAVPEAEPVGLDKTSEGEPRVANSSTRGEDSAAAGWQPFTDFIVRSEQRDKALGFLRNSSDSAVQELLRCRMLTNTVIFAPSESDSGQALDAAIAIGGLLLEDGRLNTWLRGNLLAAAAEANHAGSTEPIEEALLDLTSLGQRFNWGQLARFVGRIKNTETLHGLAEQIRANETSAPVLFAAVELTGEPDQVARYLHNFSQTSEPDLATSLEYGAGAVGELVHSNLRLHRAPFRESLRQSPVFGGLFSASTEYSLRWPGLTLTIKWLLYLTAGFLLAAAAHFARPVASTLEQPLEVRGFHLAREFLFALGFLLVVLMLSEPFLAQESQQTEFPFRLRLPVAGGLVPPGNPNAHVTLMNQLMGPKTILTLILFFVLQGLIYIACLVKLAEIKRQQVPSRVKLKLLENEEHLFDAGLYLGFAGTVVSFILVSMHVVQVSLMAAYSSTAFGIVFVSIFKIFHLRPSRRTLLLEAENAPAQGAPAPRTTAPVAASALATTP